MAEDIRIRVLPKVEKGDSASELSKIISDLEQNAKKIKVGLDDKELLSQIAKLKEQINSLSKGTNIKGNSQLFQGETKSAKELISEYKKLISQKSKLETQMSKQTYRGQAYKSLAKDLTNVNNQIKKVGSQIDGLNKKNIKSDITSSLANSFESTIKKVTELGTALENALGKRNLTGTQVADLKNLQKQIENFKSSANLENILKADKPYAEMSKLMTKASELTQAFRKVELSDALAKSIRKAESDASILQNKIKSLYSKGYGNTNAIDKLFEKAKNLQKINIRVNSKDAESSLVKFTNDIKKLESEYDKLNSKMNQQKKADVLKINVSAAISNLEKMRTKLVETGQDTSKLDGLKTRLQGLNSLTFAEATKEFSKIKKEINDISSEIPKASSAMSRFNKLMSERASLEKQMSKTTNTQSYDVLNKKLQENLSNIKKVSAELDTIKGKNINPDITRSLASTFETLQNQATKASQTIDNMFKNKNLTGGQIKQLEALKKELDRIKGTKLDNILNISNSHEHMATLLGDLQKVKNTAKEISINGDFNTKIESAYTKIQQLGQQIEKLKNVKGFLNTEDLQSRLQQVIALFNSDLKNAKVNIDSKTATQDFRNLSEVIQLVESELKELTAISENSKKSFDFTTKVNSSLERINTLIKALESMGKETSNAEKIKNELSNLSNLPLEEAESKLKRINQAIDSMSKNTTGIKTQADALREYNKLMDQKTSLEKTLSKTDVKSQSYQLLNSELEKVNSKIEATISLMSNVKLPEGNLKSLTNYSKEFSNVEKSISSLETKLSNVMNKGDKTSSQISRIQEVKNAIDKLKSVSLENILKMDKPYEQVSLLLSEIQKLDKELNSIGENITFSEKLGSQATQAKNQLQQLQTQVETFKKTKFFGDTQSIDSLIQKIKTLSGTKIDLNSEMAEEDVKRLVTNLNELQKEFDELKTKSNIDIKGFNLDTSIQTAMQKLNELEAKFKSIGKDVTPIRNLKNELQGLGKVSFKEAEAQLRKINAETAKLEREFRKATTASKNAASGISSSMKSTSKFVSNLYSTLSTYSLGNILGMQITKGIYAINDTIIELDSAFRDLEKVAPASFTGTKEELEEVKQMAYTTGQEVARSSVDIINSTASAFQLGIDNLKDAMEYAKNVNMYANVAGIDEKTADTYIKSITSAYGGVSKSLQPMTNKVKGASNAYSVLADYMDQANYAGNNFAVTSADIGEALQRSASQLKANGNTMSQSIGMIIGANETVQDASKVGTALKAMATNLNGVTYSAKTGQVTLNKTAKTLRDVAGINVVNMQKGTIKSSFDILDELHDKWSSLTDVQKAAITEAIGQKYHANTLQALLNNWETVLQYQDEYNNGFTVGSAEKENARYVDSLEGKITALKDQFKQLVTTTISTDMAKGAVGGLATGVEHINNFLTALDKINMATPVAIATISTLFSTIKAKATGSNLSIIGSGLYNSIKQSQTQVSVISNNMANASDRMKKMVSKNTSALASNTEGNMNRISKSLGGVSAYYRTYTKDTKGCLQESTKALKNATVVAEGTSKGFKETAKDMVVGGLKSTAMSVGISLLNGALISLAIGGISAAVSAIDNYVNRVEKAYETTVNGIQSTQAEISSLGTKRSTIKSMAEDYEELANKTELTGEEMQRLSGYKQQIAEMFPELVTGYDENQDPILALGNSTDALIEKLDRAIERQERLLKAQQASAAQDAGELVGDYRTNRKTNVFDDITKNTLTNPFSNMASFGKNLRDFQKGCDNYAKAYERAQEKITDINKSYAEKNAKYAEYEAQQETAAMNELMSGKYKSYSLLGNKQKGEMQQLISLYDWSNELVANNLSKRNEFLKGFDKISKYSVDHYKDVQKWNQVLEEANIAFQSTGNIEAYQKQIEGVAKQLEAITGIDASEWITGFTNQLEGGLDLTQMKLEKFLSGFGKNLLDVTINKDDVAIRLASQFDELESFMRDVTSNTLTYEQKIKIITDIGKGEGYENLPPQLQKVIQGITDGGDNVTNFEASLIMTLATTIETTGKLGDAKTNKLLEKMFNGELTEEEIQVGIKLADGHNLNSDVLRAVNNINKDKKNNIKVDLDTDDTEAKLEKLKKKIEDFKNISASKDVSNLFTAGTIDDSKLKLVEETMSKLPIDKENTISLICELGGSFNELESYEDVISYLLEHSEISSKVGLKVVGEEAINAVKNKLDQIMTSDSDKEVAIKINDALAKGDINAIREAIDSLDEEKQVTVATNIVDALSDLNTVDAIALKDKIVETYLKTDEVEDKVNKIQNTPIEKSVVFKSEGFPQVIQENEAVESGGKPVFKKFSFLTNGFTETISQTDTVSQKSKDESKTVQISTNGFTITVSQEDTVSQKSKDESKKVNISSSGYKNTITQEDNVSKKAKDETKTVTFKGIISSTLSNALAMIRGLTGFSIPVKFSNSVTDFQNISDTPNESVDVSVPIGANISTYSVGNVSSTPTEGSDGDVSASSENPFNTINKSVGMPTHITLDMDKVLYSLKNGISIFQELENRISRCSNQLSLLDKLMDNSTGLKRAEELRLQNELYTEQVILQKEYYKGLVKEKEALKSKLSDYGFKFNQQDNFTNQQENLISMQEQYDKLEKAYENAQKAESDYTGKSESKKKSLNKATEKAKDSLDKYKEKLDEANSLVNEYIKVQYTELPKTGQEWMEAQKAIEKNKDEIEELLREDKLYKFKNGVTELSNEFTSLENILDLLNAKLDMAIGKDKIDLYNKQADAIDKQRVNLQKTIDQYNEMINVYKESLSGYGFKFDKDNWVTNQKEILDKYQNNSDLEKINDLLEEFLNIQSKELPNAIVKWEQLGNEIKDIQNDKLNLTKDIEDEITKIYEDQIDKRKDKIEEEKDARIKSLEEQKKAYQDFRDEAEYKDDYNEQLNKINKLQNKISILEKDNSLASRNKLQEAYEELAEEEKALQKLQQERLDTKIEEMYDKRIEEEEKKSEDRIKELEEMWSAQKISQMVQNALSSGTFTDIDGNVKNLQDTLVTFAETSGEALGIMGDSIKNNLVNNLSSAMEVLKQYSDIYDRLELKQYGTNYKDLIDSTSNNAKTLNVGDINITVTGDLSKASIEDLTDAIDKELKYISNNL